MPMNSASDGLLLPWYKIKTHNEGQSEREREKKRERERERGPPIWKHITNSLRDKQILHTKG